MKTYRCNKCGTVVQIVITKGSVPVDHMCMAPFPQRTSGLCGGRLIPIDIKPAPCKDCD